MIWTQSYKKCQFQDLAVLFKRTNVMFYNYITELGLDLDLSKKDQQKIYFHYFVKNLCDEILLDTTYINSKIVFYINLWDICDIHRKMIKKIISIFGFKIFQHHYSLEEFIGRLETKECEVVDQFEIFLNKESKPKSFRHIKKYLDKEGLTYLSDTYFQDIINKMSVCV